jgi:hypothetical protein
MTLEELLNVLRNEEEQPFPTFRLQDFDGNQIYGEDLYLSDLIVLRSWKVEKIIVAPAELFIILNGGNFVNFKFKNVITLR